MKQKKILVTGGAGFVGSNIALLTKIAFPDHDIVCLDNLKRRGSELNLSRLRAGGVQFVHGDIRNKEDFLEVGPFEILIECSAEPSVLAGITGSPEYLLNTNLVGTLNCLELCRKFNALIIFLSTSRVYPVQPLCSIPLIEQESRFEFDASDKGSNVRIGLSSAGISEKFPLDGYRTLYGATKLASEFFITEYINTYGMKGIINRCGVLTGPWQMGKVDQGFIVLWLAKHIYGGQLSYIGYGGKGIQVRDILHVNDLFELILAQLKDISLSSGQIFNIGGGREISVSLLELTRMCKEITGAELEISPIPNNRPGDIPYYISDYSKAAEIFDWKPKILVPAILSEIAQWIIDNKNILAPILS
jgi:CDP-paratose 2-epimerase